MPAAVRTIAHRVFTSSPSDVSGLRELLDRNELLPDEIVAVVGKTEGNGGRNDFTRELATSAVCGLIAERGGCDEAEVHRRVVLSFSGGCEGVVSPHLCIFARRGEPLAQPRADKRLAIGVGWTRAFAPEEIGYRPQIEETTRAVREVAASLRLESLADVHLVQMKGAIPAATFEQAEAARPRGTPLRNDMVHSRAASALAAGVAVGEVDDALATDEAVCSRWDLYSTVASVSAKPGLERTEIMVLANSPWWEGDLRIEHGVMRDLLDVDAVRAVLGRFGSPATPAVADRVVGVFAKAEADPRGTVRGRRHVMLDDDDVSDTRWSRCALGAVLASVLGDTGVYVSTRAEHHGPLGGGPIAIVGRVT
jgi:cyanuric acid amidohydrolase